MKWKYVWSIYPPRPPVCYYNWLRVFSQCVVGERVTEKTHLIWIPTFRMGQAMISQTNLKDGRLGCFPLLIYGEEVSLGVMICRVTTWHGNPQMLVITLILSVVHGLRPLHCMIPLQIPWLFRTASCGRWCPNFGLGEDVLMLLGPHHGAPKAWSQGFKSLNQLAAKG